MEPIPEDIARFMNSHVESLDQLEILRVLGEDEAREWTATALAAEIQGRPADVAGHLSALQSRGMIGAEPRGSDLVCRFGPGDPKLDDAVRRLLQLYRERPVSMIKLVYARAADPVRALAEAFRFRKEEG